MSRRLQAAPLHSIAAALRSGTRDLREYLHAICDRIDAFDPDIQAFVSEPNRRERLLQEADALLARFPDPASRPPLFGVLVGVKDIFRVNGFPTQAGSLLPADLFAGEEAECVTRLKQAGALIAGKTVTTEFAYFEPGPTRNPQNLAHTPGGSSSGSAAGVACGFFPFALGTQTIGSVIRPAAYCGIVGFKPSFNRIPTAGMLYFSPSADHVGLFTQDIEGMQLACSIVCQEWNTLAPSAALPTLGVPEGDYLAQASEEGLSAFFHQVQQLEEAGFVVKRLPMFADIHAINQRHRLMTIAEAAKEHAAWFAAYRERYRPRLTDEILQGQQVTPETLRRGQASQAELRQRLEEAQMRHGIDLWISPAATGDAPAGIHATGDPAMNFPWTHAGVPTVTIPAGCSRNHLPLGLQCSARFWEDERLLAGATALRAALRIPEQFGG